MSNYKLTYFDARGKGETIRLLFAVAGQKYEDNRVKFENWPQVKPTTPFGQIPVLEVDGITLCQSAAIERFLANRFGLAGKTDLEKAQVDMIVDCIADTVQPSIQIRLEKDEAKKAELRAKISKESLPNHIANLEKLLKTNKGGDGYFVGDSLTWADIRFIDAYKWLTVILLAEPDLSAAPKLKALKEKVEAHPKIAEWIKNRPQTDL